MLRLSAIGLNSYFRPPLRQSASSAAAAASGGGGGGSAPALQQREREALARRAHSVKLGAAPAGQHRRGGSWAGPSAGDLQGLVDTVRAPDSHPPCLICY